MVKVQKGNEFITRSYNRTASFNIPLLLHKAVNLKITLQKKRGTVYRVIEKDGRDLKPL
jgi:hypothetical protein